MLACLLKYLIENIPDINKKYPYFSFCGSDSSLYIVQHIFFNNEKRFVTFFNCGYELSDRSRGCRKIGSQKVLSETPNLVPRVLSYPPYGARERRVEERTWEQGCETPCLSNQTSVIYKCSYCIRTLKQWLHL